MAALNIHEQLVQIPRVAQATAPVLQPPSVIGLERLTAPLWLLLDDDAGETLRIELELVISRRNPTNREHVGDDIDELVVGQRPRIAFRHRRPRVFE